MTPAKTALDAVRRDGATETPSATTGIEVVEGRLDAAIAEALNGLTVKDLAALNESGRKSEQLIENAK